MGSYNPMVGELDALEDVTHAQIVDAESDWMWGDLGNPNEDSLTHHVGARPQVLTNEL
jgi:hypothetical protein